MQDLFESQEQTQCWLISRDAKGKIRCIDINFTKEGDGYVIHRTSFQYQGKRTLQPSITITQGKVKRDAHAQTILQFMSLVKSYKDKGYKEIENDPDTYTEENLNSILPEFTTDANGFKNMVNTNISEYGQKLISSWTAQQQQTQNSSMVAGINSYNEAAKRVTDLQVQLSNIPKTNTEARNAVQLQIDSAKNSMLRIKESTDAVITKTVEMESSYNGTADPSKCPGAVFDAATGNFVTTLGKFVRQDDGTYNYETNGTPETENVTIPKEQAQIQQRFADDVTKAKDSADKEKEKLSGTSGKK